MNPPRYPASSVTPTQNNLFRHGRSMSNESAGSTSKSREGLQASFRDGREGRSLSNAAVTFGPRGSSLAQGPPPGSFSSDLKTISSSRAGTPRTEQGPFFADYRPNDSETTSEQRQTELRDRINKEIKIKVGSENLLEALISKNAKQTKEQRLRVEAELGSSNRKIVELRSQLEEEVERSKRPKTPPRERLSGIFQSSPLKFPRYNDEDVPEEAFGDPESESPTYVLSEILQTLENEGMQPDYYVERANRLVYLFKKYPSLNQSRDVVAAGYRVTRHAITDRGSLQTIRRLNSDELVMLSLVKDSKANIEREQALKFVRAFLDVKGGIHELTNPILRTIVSVAEHHEDRLRNMSILTLLEILVRKPAMVIASGGMASLTEALLEGTYQGSESLALAILYLFDKPSNRLYLKSCHELDAAFTIFTDPIAVHSSEEKLKSSARLITALLNSWSGLFSVANDGFAAVRGLFQSLSYPSLLARDIVLDIIFAVLRIRAPSWSSSFLAGRRLTTYGRVANLTIEFSAANTPKKTDDENESWVSLTENYTAILLAVFLQSGLQEALSSIVQEESESALRRKAALLQGEVLDMTNRLLPFAFSARFQVVPKIVEPLGSETLETSLGQVSMVYQVDSVSRTLHRSQADPKMPFDSTKRLKQQSIATSQSTDPAKPKPDFEMDEIRFRAAVFETQVLNHIKYIKWNWDLIEDLVEGPLKNPKRLSEAIANTKFLKRLLGFYRPFKYRFSEMPNTKPNQRYLRIGVSLMNALLQNPEGIAYLSESKFLRQLGECLAQLDRASGLTSSAPLFSLWRTSETLTSGYFSMLGALSSNSKGLQMIERWHMVNIFYHIVDLEDRDDLVELLLGSMDFTLDSHLRVMLSKALTACDKRIRIFSTRLLRKYATLAPDHGGSLGSRSPSSVCEWAIRLLVTQLYDPEVEVSEVAVQILEESCRWKSHLEYIVRCRPQLDHLNEIGAPLLLRFLSTSSGYQYLDRLDYITQEMDDWFSLRNYRYVTLVEASLTRALATLLQGPPRSSSFKPLSSPENGSLPPHFYRELTRTQEGCGLLRDSGHFHEFVTTIAKTWTECEDAEGLTKLKGCLWAVGNIGSMELGADFLEETDVVSWIVRIAEQSEVTTLRGTAFLVLGLISRSLHGMEIIVENGWTAATNQFGRSIGYCLPQQLSVFFSMDSQRVMIQENSKAMAKAVPPLPVEDRNPVHARVLGLVADTANAVLAKKAANDLNGTKVRHPEAFTSVELYRKVRDVLGSHSFRLPVRRFLLDLFDKSVMRRIVLDEDESENESIRTERPSQAQTRPL
ncbi:MAG: hypothetical protein Q9219_005697 [cf. Caloplaca sp. 3 TL-2023]